MIYDLNWRATHASPLLPKDTLSKLGSLLDEATDLGKIIFGPKDNTPNQPKSDSERSKSLPGGLQDLFGGKKKQ